jgi:hypothetical protein
MHHLILLHGMGEFEIEQRFYGPFEALLREMLAERKLDFDEHITLHLIYYTEVVKDAKWAVFHRAFPEYRGTIPPMFDKQIGFGRYFLTVFMGDVVSYSSTEGERRLRNYVYRELDKIIRHESPSFSILAHSLGSIIAYDYLFDLFGKPNTKRRRVRRDGRQRLDHLFTTGSPIALFLLRKAHLMLKAGALSKNPVGLRRPRGSWLNFWNHQDVMAYPLERFFPRLVSDRLVDTGSLIFNSHLGYWTNRHVAEQIADTLLGTTGRAKRPPTRRRR